MGKELNEKMTKFLGEVVGPQKTLARKPKPKRMTNVQLIKDIMENSKYGPLAQLFVMDALFKLSDAVAESKPEDYTKDGVMLVVNPHSWIGLAKEIQVKLKRPD